GTATGYGVGRGPPSRLSEEQALPRISLWALPARSWPRPWSSRHGANDDVRAGLQFAVQQGSDFRIRVVRNAERNLHGLDRAVGMHLPNDCGLTGRRWGARSIVVPRTPVPSQGRDARLPRLLHAI